MIKKLWLIFVILFFTMLLACCVKMNEPKTMPTVSLSEPKETSTPEPEKDPLQTATIDEIDSAPTQTQALSTQISQDDLFAIISAAATAKAVTSDANELSILVENYVHAYGGIIIVNNIQMDAMQLTLEIQENTVIYTQVKNVDGVDHTLLVVNDTPLAYLDADGIWRETTMKFLGDLVGLKIGTLLSPHKVSPATFWEKEYHIGAICVNNAAIPKEHQPMSWNYNNWELEVAEYSNLKITRLHNVLFPHAQPEWSKENLDQEILDYLMRIVINYAKENEITEIIVVGEAAHCQGDFYCDLYWKQFGIDYIVRAFQMTRDIYPEAKLIYEDHSNHIPGTFSTKTTMMIVNRLVKEGLIDYVGVEMQIEQYSLPNKNEMVYVFNQYPIPVIITSFMAKIDYLPEEKKNEEMDRITKIVFDGCLESNNCLSVSTWGENDKDSWEGRSLLRDEDNNRKSAYYVAMQSMFLHLSLE